MLSLSIITVNQSSQICCIGFKVSTKLFVAIGELQILLTQLRAVSKHLAQSAVTGRRKGTKLVANFSELSLNNNNKNKLKIPSYTNEDDFPVVK